MRKIGILLFTCSLVLFGCDKNNSIKDKEPEVCDVDCAEANMEEYELLKGKEHVFLDTTYEQAIEKLEDKEFTGIFYFGYPGCPWCEEAVVKMNKVAKAKKKSIYYVNKKSEENLKKPELEGKIIKILDQAYGLKEDKEGKKRLYVPEVIVIKDGEIVSHHTGTVEGHDARERKMNEDEKDLLEVIYNKMFQKIEK